jgi:AmmeMemoRadiSam system protein A
MGLMSSMLDDPALPQPLGPGEGARLVEEAWDSIRHGLSHGTPGLPDLAALPQRLRDPGAAFVTLEIDGALRGCIGSLEPVDPLAADVARNAFKAAFQDPRFPPLSDRELDRLDLKISVLGPPVPVPAHTEAELLAALEPGLDGLILELPPLHRSTFLPQVWDSLPEGRAFLAHLRQKAGLPSDFWSSELLFHRYRMREVR